MSPFEKDVLLPKLLELNRWAGAIYAVLLADHIGIPERSARHYLKRMELAGAVSRPYGQRRGWIAVGIQLRAVQAAV